MSFSILISNIREKLNLTQQEMANDLNVSFATINRWEQGHNEPSQKKQSDILNYYKDKGFFDNQKSEKSVMFGLSLVSAKMIEDWFLKDKRKLEEFMPEIIEKLVIESTNGKITGLRIPTGSNIWIPGVDGKFKNINNQVETPFVPSGEIILEIGTTVKTLKKISEDFTKRDTTYSYDQKKDTTFILITAKIWAYKEDKNNFAKRINTSWKNVVIYDALDLEKWLSQCIETSVYALEYMQNTKLEIRTVDSMWKMISNRTNPQTKESLFLAGRDGDLDKFIKEVESKVKKRIDIRASSRDEALGFVIASLSIKKNSDNNILVLNDIESFKLISKLVDDYLLIANFDVEQIDLFPNNRYVCLFGNSSSDNRSYDIKLAERPFSIVSKSMSEDLGLDSGSISILSSKCGNNIMCIIRSIASEQFIDEPSWRKKSNLIDLIPILILGRIDTSNPKDMELIKFITGTDPNEYMRKLSNWKAVDESPLMFIGSSIKVNSNIELWNELHNYIDLNLVNKVCECLSNMFEVDLKHLPLSNNAFVKSYEMHSDYSYNGIISLLTIYSMNFEHPIYIINNTVKNILELSKNQRSIKLISKYYLQLSECSPQVFLDFVSLFLIKNEDVLLSLYAKDNSVYDFFGENDYVHILHSLTALTLLDQFKIQALNILLKIYILDVKNNLSKSPEDTLVNILSILNTTNALLIDEKKNFLIAQCKKNGNLVHKLILKVVYSNSIVLSDGYLKWRIPQSSDQELTNLDVYNFINEVLVEVVNSLTSADFGVIKEIINNFQFLNSKITQPIENYCKSVLESEESKYLIYEYLDHKIYSINRFREKNEYENIINFLTDLMNKIKPNDLFFSNLIFFKTFTLFNEEYHYLSDEELKDKLDILKEKFMILKETYSCENLINLLASHLKDDYSTGLMLANILDEKEIHAWSIYFAENDRMELLSHMLSHEKFKFDLKKFFNSLDSKKKIELIEKFSLNSNIKLDSTILTDNNLLKVYWENRRLTNKSDLNDKYFIKKYNPTAYLQYVNYHQKFMEWNIDEILDILIDISQDELLKHRDSLYSIEEMITKIDDNIYNEKIVIVAFKFMKSSYHRKLYKSIRKYFFENPLELLNLMNSKYEMWYTIKMSYYLPDDYSSDINKLLNFSNTFQNYSALGSTDNIIAAQTLGEILARTSRKNGDIFIPITLRDIIEKAQNEELKRGYLIGYTNTFEARFVDDGTREQELSILFKEKAKEVELDFPETASLFRMIANDHIRESNRMKKDNLIGY